MAFISKFKSDTAYSNQDINEVLSAITGAGIIPYSPNEILSNVAESGVTLSDERCNVVWADDERTSIKICTGTVIMPDGSYIIISDEVLPLSSKELHYVYVYNDLIHQNIPLCEKSLPDDGRDYILLAEVENRHIVDKRVLASSKIPGYGTHPIIKSSISIGIPYVNIPAGTPLFSLDIGEGYSHLIISTHHKNSISVYNLEKGIFEKSLFSGNKTYSSGKEHTSYPGIGQITLHYVNGVLSMTASNDLYAPFAEYNYVIDLTVF